MTNIVPDTHVEYNVCVSELLPDHYDDKTTTESKSEWDTDPISTNNEIANVNFFYNDILHVVQNIIRTQNIIHNRGSQI